MDQVTQQNAAMVEQSTAASHALSGEADAMSRQVSRFELGDSMVRQFHPSRAEPDEGRAVRRITKVGSRNGAAHRPPAVTEEAWAEF